MNSPESNEITTRSHVTLAEAFRQREQLSLDRRQATRPVSVAYQSSGYAAVLEELCAIHAQAMGWSEPLTKQQRIKLIHAAFDELGVARHGSITFRAEVAMKEIENVLEARKIKRKANKDLERGDRRRARLVGARLEPVIRAEIIARDESTCYLCERICEPSEIHLDHVIPLSRGGAHSPENVRVSCATCNLRKAATLLSANPAIV